MLKQLHYLYLVILLSIYSGAVSAQNTITTQPLAITGICPGSTIDVPFTASGTYQSSNVFTAQLSNGSEYVNVPTGAANFNNTTGRYTVTATIPASTPAGTTYRVRVNSSSPAVIGSPSTTQFSVKIKPGVPGVDSLVLLCQAFSAMQQVNPISLTVRTSPNALASLYNSDGTVAGGYYYPDTRGINSTSFNLQYGSFGYSQTQVYPVSERKFYATQSIDGCESEKVTMTVRTLYWPLNGPNPANQFDVQFGRLSYCQGEQAQPLNVNGHKPAINGYRILYRGPEQGAVLSSNAPTPSTNTPGRTTYALRYESTDPTKYCTPQYNASSPLAETYLQVDVKPRPTKPALSTTPLTYCQNQTTTPLSASTTDASASLVWYGTDATGGSGSATAPRPSTSQAGTFKYYAAQVLNNCESDRAEITVEVKAASPNPTATNVTYCVGQQGVALSAVAASGGSLLWYTAATGGTGTQAAPTPTTGTASNQTYYVAQTVGNGCESERVPVTAAVNGLPPAPSVNTAINTFCQNSAGSPLSASGQNLKWYDVPTGGSSAGTLTPITSTVGVKNYYVSQTVNNCEGPRTTVNVVIKEVPGSPTPLDTLYSFCAGTSNSVIQANLNGETSTYTWFGNNGQPVLINLTSNGNTVAATVPTNQIGTFTYWLTKTANGCESAASRRIKVTINSIPVAPSIQPIAVCQGATAPTVQATGQGLLWYDTNSGGTGSAISPVVSTAQASQKIYYVSQTLNGCESVRSALAVNVSAVPAAPTISNGPAYCQNAQATPLLATGDNLRWYTEATGGSGQATLTPERIRRVVSRTMLVRQLLTAKVLGAVLR